MPVTADAPIEGRLLGIDYANTVTRLCRGCNYRLPLTYFYSLDGHCVVCRDARISARPWTTAQLDALLRAVRGVLDLWPLYIGVWQEDDLVRLRALLEAADRLPLKPKKPNKKDVA